jgi:uncharacterized protein (TIGR02147 family)
MEPTPEKVYETIDIQQHLRDGLQFPADSPADEVGFFGKLIEKIATFFGRSKDDTTEIDQMHRLNDHESIYMRQMVKFRQAKTNEERELEFAKLKAIRPVEYSKTMNSDELIFYRYWFTGVVRELMCRPGFRGDFRKLATQLEPTADPLEVEDACRTLIRLGMIQQEFDGKFVQTDHVILNDERIASKLVVGHQAKMIDLGKRSLLTHHGDTRDIMCMTFGVSSEDITKLREIVQKMQGEIVTLLQNSNNQEDLVFHLNVQLFPVSKKTST